MENGIVSEDKNKPVLDEQTLAKLLEAAYVLQEHNREMRALELSMELKRDQVEAQDRAAEQKTSKPKSTGATPPADYTLTLAQIVETQHHIQVRHLELDNTLRFVAQRVLEIGRARGASIGLTEGNHVRYRAAAGLMTLSEETIVPLDKSLCAPCLKTGQVFRCGDVNPEFLLDTEECRRRGIASMIAVPVFHNGNVVGGLELYYSTQDAFSEQDVHTCQLMAGLITEALAREEELTWKKSLATERAAMLEALEKLKPNLAALLDHPPAKESSPKATVPVSDEPYTCPKCGHKLVGEEQFCGQCGSPRASDYEPHSMQSKVASLWQMQESLKKDASGDAPNSPEPTSFVTTDEDRDLAVSLAQSLEAEIPELFAASDVPINPVASSPKPAEELLENTFEEEGTQETAESPEAQQKAGSSDAVALARPAPAANWGSAASARQFLEELASSKRSSAFLQLWNTRRGDIYLVVAVILVACVIRWGIWSGHSVSATAAPNAAAAHKATQPELSFFDRMLIGLGLAEAPEASEDRGNPSVQVWVDTHTALYYCPGADLYGKTPTGKYVIQREAQLDQFQPAYRKACN